MIVKHTRSLFVLLFFLFCTVCFGETISIRITPDHQDWTYALGEQACFHLSISGDITEEYTISYDIGLEKMAPVKSATFKSSNSSLMIEAGTVDAPGFLRCTVTVIHAGETYSGVATAAFEPEKIKPTTKCPRDFDRFWKEAISEARNISVPGFFSWGFNDPTTPPTSFYSAYNVIKAPKQTYIIPEGVHKIYPEQVERTYQWIFNFFGR